MHTGLHNRVARVYKPFFGLKARGFHLILRKSHGFAIKWADRVKTFLSLAQSETEERPLAAWKKVDTIRTNLYCLRNLRM